MTDYVGPTLKLAFTTKILCVKLYECIYFQIYLFIKVVLCII